MNPRPTFGAPLTVGAAAAGIVGGRDGSGAAASCRDADLDDGAAEAVVLARALGVDDAIAVALADAASVGDPVPATGGAIALGGEGAVGAIRVAVVVVVFRIPTTPAVMNDVGSWIPKPPISISPSAASCTSASRLDERAKRVSRH